MTQPEPDKAIPPAQLLREELEHRGMTPEQLAPLMAWRLDDVVALVEGRVSMTTAAAARLQVALGVDAGLWMHLQTAYEDDLARLRGRR